MREGAGGVGAKPRPAVAPGHDAHVTVALWVASLDVPADTLASFERSLSGAERARADTLRGPGLRRCYVADHGWRRRLLGRLIGCAPAEIEYTSDEHGKPRLKDAALRFNASHTADIALYVTSETAEVGVDVEQIRADVDLAAMARRFFSPAESAALAATAPEQRGAAVFACWTRKEAYAKAAGTGFVFPLSDLDVWAGDDRPVRWGEIEVHGVEVAPGMAAAVAVQAACGTLHPPAGEVLWLHKSLPSF